MRKYTTYRRSAPSSRSRSVTRARRTFSFFRPLFSLLLVAALGFGIYLGLHKGYEVLMQSTRGKWQAKSIAVEGVNGPVHKDIIRRVEPYQGKLFSLKDAYALRSELVSLYPMLKDVSVKRGLLNGTLSVVAKPREPVAQLKLTDGKVKYVDKDSNVYADPYLISSNVPTVELVGAVPEKVGSDFTDLVQNVLQLDKQLAFETLRLNVTENTLVMVLPGQTVLDFGPARQLKQKAQRASQILSFARAHYTGPYQLDFRFFDEGKVFLTRAQN